MYEFRPEDAEYFAKFVGIPAKVQRGQLQFLKCPYCGRTTSDKYTFAISLKTGQFKCLRSSCGVTGNMLTLSQDFNYSLGPEIDEYYRPKKEFKSFKAPEKIVPKEPAVQYLLSRGISEAVTQRYEITCLNGNPKILAFPFRNVSGEVLYVKYRKTDFDKSKDSCKEWCQTNGKPILFGMNHCNPENKTLIFTEGQIDSLSVIEAGYENVVSVPNGCNGFTWVPYCYDWVNNFKTIIVFGDYEKGHMTLLDDIKRRFRHEIRHVRYEDYKDCKDANDILRKYGKAQIRNCIENAEKEPIPHMRSLKDIEAINPYELPKIKTGITYLDRLLKGGLPRGSVVLITGKAGEGKSVFASQLMLEAVEQGNKVFAYSGELPDWAFKSIALLQAAGPHCFKYETRDGNEGYSVSDNNRILIEEWFKDIQLFDDRIEDEKIQLTSLIEESIQRYGIDFVLIDNLMTGLDLEETGEANKYDRQSAFVKRLARIARTYNIVLVLVAHMRKNNRDFNGNDEVAGSSDISNLASITLMYEKDSQLPEDQRLLKVWKNRLFGYTDTKGKIMYYEEKSKRIYADGDNVNKEYGWFKPEADFSNDIPDEIPFD